MPGGCQVSRDDFRDFVEWIIWALIFGGIIGATLWIMLVGH